MSKVIEYTRDIFGDEDEYRCCYRGNYGNRYGFLVLSNKRLLFLHEKGISSDFDKTGDIPIENIWGYTNTEREVIAIKAVEKFR